MLQLKLAAKPVNSSSGAVTHFYLHFYLHLPHAARHPFFSADSVPRQGG